MLVIETMFGMGDNFWSRPVIAAAARRYEICLKTPWPQCYADLAERYGIRFAKPDTKLRTQCGNVERQPASTWVDPLGPAHIKIIYKPAEIAAGANHHDSLTRSAKWLVTASEVDPKDIVMDVPSGWLDRAADTASRWGRRPVLVRPPTVRKEWCNPARNCDPESLRRIVDTLWASGHHLVEFADLVDGVEWIVRDHPTPPPFHRVYHHGELPVETLVGLMALGVPVIGANGFIVPMALAAAGWLFALFGGNYGYNAPSNLFHDGYDMTRVGYAEPDAPHLGCTDSQCGCSKKISPSRLFEAFDLWRAKLESSRDRSPKLEIRAAG